MVVQVCGVVVAHSLDFLRVAADLSVYICHRGYASSLLAQLRHVCTA